MNDFDRIAKSYDFLAKIVFGSGIKDCQTHFLSMIPASSNILILGGGTGWLLKELEIKTKNCCIWYIERSEQMLSLAKSKGAFHQVVFIHGDDSDIPNDIMFDVVITNFFLDLFPEEKLKLIVQTIRRSIKKNSIWLVSDFVNREWWHRLFLWIMYRFFKRTAKIEASMLPPWQLVLRSQGLKERVDQYFYGTFIKSAVYKNIYF